MGQEFFFIASAFTVPEGRTNDRHSVYYPLRRHGLPRALLPLRLSRDLPIIVEVVDTQENVDRVMPKIDEMMSWGLITVEKVTVTRYTHRHEE